MATLVYPGSLSSAASLSQKCLLDITGQDLIGCALRAPNAIHPKVYALPMLTILTTKGTGIVTSVPSDAPDDYMALMDLKSKPALREKFGVKARARAETRIYIPAGARLPFAALRWGSLSVCFHSRDSST